MFQCAKNTHSHIILTSSILNTNIVCPSTCQNPTRHSVFLVQPKLCTSPAVCDQELSTDAFLCNAQSLLAFYEAQSFSQRADADHPSEVSATSVYTPRPVAWLPPSIPPTYQGAPGNDCTSYLQASLCGLSKVFS